METTKAGGEMSRRSFFKLGLAGISAAMLLFVSGCGGEEDEEDEDD